MAIVSREEVKQLANITDIKYNNLIDTQIPIVTALISDYTKNDFIKRTLQKGKTLNGYSNYVSADISVFGNFVISDNVITSEVSSFEDFKVGDNILITDSIRNNGYYTISEKTDTTITTEEDLENETNYIYIYFVFFSKSEKNIAARMVAWDVLEKNKTQGVESERIGAYSVKYRDICGSGYPEAVVAGLKKFHRGK